MCWLTHSGAPFSATAEPSSLWLTYRASWSKTGRAVGVRLSDDTEIRADKAVVSAIDIKQTFLDMVGEDDLEPAFVEQVKNYRLDEFSIFGVHLALKEAPRFTAAADDPDINQAFKINIGCETPADFARVWAEIRAGELPHRPGMYCSIPTLYDQSQAPAGQHTAIIWQLAPYELRDGGAEAWDRIKDDYADECIAHWATYAPNLTSDNVMMRVAYSPLDIERKLINMRRGGVFRRQGFLRSNRKLSAASHLGQLSISD